MNIGFHHFFYRYREFDHQLIKSNRFKSLIDRGVYACGFLGILVITPQIIKIWVNRETSGISLITWLGFTTGSLFWMFYGLIHREKPIILTNLLVVLADLAVILGLIFIK